ncbi:MAG: DUF4912 domain-containing protein [Nitrospirae bacterium]|nr:MAG: DUF4912 domain-containing protein [Nitrospirota bacterium]
MKKKETKKKTVKPGAKKQVKKPVKKAKAKIKKKIIKKIEEPKQKTKAKKEVKKPAKEKKETKKPAKKAALKKPVKKPKEKAKKTTPKQKITKTSGIALREKETKKIAMPKTKPAKPARTIKVIAASPAVSISKTIKPEKTYQPAVFKKGLPAEYGKDRITLMTVDPWKLFAYWEVSGEMPAKLKGKLVLRVYDVTGIYFDGRNANIVFDIPVHERVGDGYIGVGPGRNFVVAIGIVTPDGSFAEIALSNNAATPAVMVTMEEGLLPQAIEPVGYL